MIENSLKKIAVILILIIAPIFVYSDDNKIPLGVYEYVYEYNTDSLIENHYIMLSKKNDKIIGQYFGTSDDFDDLREGYLPGFFSAKMEDLKFKGNKISFTVLPSKFFKNPITPLKAKNKNLPWGRNIMLKKRKYYGEYQDGKLIINSKDLDARIFRKIK